jgi:CubicO group peptidase (beta-lactamase class C family)
MRTWARRLVARVAWAGAVLALALPSPARAEEALRDALPEALQAELTAHRLAGVTWALVDGDRVHTGALGVADQATGRPLAAHDVVEVGSVAKPLIALAVLRAASLGRLSLDEPVQARLPQFAVDNPWQATHPLRLRHLLDMTSGLEDIRLWHFFDRRHGVDQPLALAFTRDASVLRLRSAPGTRFSYSNLGFTMAAMVLEAAVGERYETWMTRELLRPLGLHATVLGALPPGMNAARGHVDDAGPVDSLPTAVRPAARLLTTVGDLARLLQFVVAGDGRLHGRDFIDPALMRQLGRPTGTDAARAGLATGYGLGWFTRDRHGAVGLCHGGSVAGWRALVCAWPEARRGFALVHNHDREGAAYDRFDALLVRALGVATPALRPGADPVPEAERAFSGRYLPAPSRLHAMALPDRLLGTWVLDLRATPPTLAPSFGPPRPLLRLGPNLYRQADRQQATLALGRDARGMPQVHGFGLTLAPLGTAAFAAPWVVVGGAAAGLLWWLLRPPWRRWRHGQPLRGMPAFWAALALLLASALWAGQPWQALGELTAGSAALAAATAWLPVGAAWQAARLLRGPGVGPGTPARVARALDFLALAGLLALPLLLASFGLWPLLLWRV